jgi:hypothetical protein
MGMPDTGPLHDPRRERMSRTPARPVPYNGTYGQGGTTAWHQSTLCPSDVAVPVCGVHIGEHALHRPVPARSTPMVANVMARTTVTRYRSVRPAGDVSPYAEVAYRAARAELTRFPKACWKSCGRPATTIDHVPALARHAHIPGTGCCELLPCCAACNMAAGARIGNRGRTPRRPYASRQW